MEYTHSPRVEYMMLVRTAAAVSEIEAARAESSVAAALEHSAALLRMRADEIEEEIIEGEGPK